MEMPKHYRLVLLFHSPSYTWLPPSSMSPYLNLVYKDAASLELLGSILYHVESLSSFKGHHRISLDTLSTSSSPLALVPTNDLTNTTDNDRALFLNAWTQYKEMFQLTGAIKIQNELRMTCTPEVSRLLFDLIGTETLNSATEGRHSSHIPFVVVKDLNKEVHQQIFHSTHQAKGESVT